ncbi:MAG: pantothenate kinase, partial [Pseudomonadota bacterium]|nr:pantothenate kinase [Pseudomonadota bacterium]
RVIGTGGLAALFSDCTDAIDQVDEDLTLHGLVLIHRLNRRAGAVHGA